MKSKKGFTLIELLAVIVILAVIALIATPIIIGVIEQARKKAFENTAYGVLEGLRLNYTERILTGTTSTPKEFTFPNSGLKLSGEEPAYGNAKIDSKGNISFALADKDKKWCAKKESDSEKVTMEDYSAENCKIDGTSGGEVTDAVADGTAVYFDPKLGTKCDTYTEANSATGIKEGCMKFYTFGGNNDSDKVNLLLDHNTTGKVAWSSSNTNTEMKEVKESLETGTTGWTGNPRLITADEIAKITGNTSFNSATTYLNGWFYFDSNNQTQVANSSNKSKYAWLFDRTYNCTSYGCNIADSSTYGYWTSTAVSDSSTNVWFVHSIGHLYYNGAYYSSNYGVRPVITVLKSNVS